MQENSNKAIVEALYNALAKGQTEKVAKFLATDLEWWFHGPPKCQHMMKVLTGDDSGRVGFTFEPRSVTEIGDMCVVAEGWEGAQAYWVHVWTIKEGLITQFREYFNTWLTVSDLKPLGWKKKKESFTVWQSMPRDLFHCVAEHAKRLVSSFFAESSASYLVCDFSIKTVSLCLIRMKNVKMLEKIRVLAS